MKVERNFAISIEKPQLQVGDVIEHTELGFYLIIQEAYNESYIAKSFNGVTGLFGRHDSLEELNEHFYKNTYKKCTIYKPDEYSLELVKKKVATS